MNKCQVAAVVESLQRAMTLLCVTGMKDRLQDNVRPTLEMLRNAGIKVSNSLNHFIDFNIEIICKVCLICLHRFGC